MTIKNLIVATGLSVALLSCGSSNAPRSTTESAAPGTTGNAQSLVRITSDPVPEFYPRISPDGRKMVFHIRDDNKKDANEKFSIMMMNLGQPGRIPLVGAYTQTPSFFPDSKTILYTYMKPSRPVIAKSMTDGASGINYISPNAMGDYDNQASVSPDGKKILFETKFGGALQIAMMDLTGMNPTILTDGYDPRWHPKGDRIVYSKTVGKYGQIFEYNLATGQSTQLTSGEYSSVDPSYSVDGKYIAFGSTRDNQNEHLFMMSGDGSQITQLTQGNSRNGMPCFAPNGDIYFCSNSGSKTERLNWSSSDIWKLTPNLNR
jgi:TolB protein